MAKKSFGPYIWAKKKLQIPAIHGKQLRRKMSKNQH